MSVYVAGIALSHAEGAVANAILSDVHAKLDELPANSSSSLVLRAVAGKLAREVCGEPR